MISDEAVERAARAMHDLMWGATGDGKEGAWLAQRGTLRTHARAALTAAEPSMIGEIERLRAALHNCLPLVRLKFGNLDPDVNAVMADAVAALATEPVKEG